MRLSSWRVEGAPKGFPKRIQAKLRQRFKFKHDTHRVVDLDGLAGIENVDVIRSSRPFTDRVFGQAEDGVKVLGEPVADSCIEGTKDTGSKRKN